MYFDDKPHAVAFLKEKGVNAQVFTTWEETAIACGILLPGSLLQQIVSLSRLGKSLKKWLKASLREQAGKNDKLQALRAELEQLPVCWSATVGRETVVLHVLPHSIIGYHGTPQYKKGKILKEGLQPYALLGQEQEQTPVVFFYLDQKIKIEVKAS